MKRLQFVVSPFNPLRWVRYRWVDGGAAGTNPVVTAWVEWVDGNWKLYYWNRLDRCEREADALNSVQPTLALLLMHAEIDGVFDKLA